MANNKKKAFDKEEAQRVCETVGVKEIYCNSRGEYFTQKTYAVLSENGDASKVSVYKKEDTKVETPKTDKNE